MKDKTLGVIALSLALGLNNAGCDKGKEPQQTQPVYKAISGKIISIDEDSIDINVKRGGANFEFEHFRIKASDGKTYKLIFPGPSNYQVGDVADFRYKVQSRVFECNLLRTRSSASYSECDLLSAEERYSLYGEMIYFDADGLILR